MTSNQNYRYPLEKAMILLFPVITLSIIGVGAFLFVIGPDLLRPVMNILHF